MLGLVVLLALVVLALAAVGKRISRDWFWLTCTGHGAFA